MYDQITQQSVTLEHMRFAAKYIVDEQLAHLGGEHAVEILRDFADRRYAIEIRSKFYGLRRDVELPPVPVSWWDHFKRDAIPTFRRWFGLAVNERREIIKAATIFPDVKHIPGGRFYWHEIAPMQYVKD